MRLIDDLRFWLPMAIQNQGSRYSDSHERRMRVRGYENLRGRPPELLPALYQKSAKNKIGRGF
jgi:hypothetical protein